MDNFFNNGPKILKLIVRVRIYHILIYIEKKIVGLKIGFLRIFFCRLYRSQTDYSEIEIAINTIILYIHLFVRDRPFNFLLLFWRGEGVGCGSRAIFSSEPEDSFNMDKQSYYFFLDMENRFCLNVTKFLIENYKLVRIWYLSGQFILFRPQN